MNFERVEEIREEIQRSIKCLEQDEINEMLQGHVKDIYVNGIDQPNELCKLFAKSSVVGNLTAKLSFALEEIERLKETV